MLDRYSRQQLFAPIGENGQEKIGKKHVLIIGAGALGSSSAESLVRAGIGKLTLIDRDYVEWSNLQRQQLYTEEDASKKLPKAIAAKQRLKSINADVMIDALVMDARAENMDILLDGIDVIIDATDNFDIRFIINDLSQKYNIPWIYGSCVGSYGMCCTILPEDTPCLNCILKSVPISGATCDTVGIISPTVQLVAAHQVVEAMKILVEDYSSINKNFVTFDLWNNQHLSIKVDRLKSEECPSCGTNKTYPYLSYENQTKTETLCGRNTVQIRPSKANNYDFDTLEKQLMQHGKVERNPYLLSCQLQEYRFVMFLDGRVFIHGTNDIQIAKKLFYSLLG
ncbi:molybdopterin-synthase adenylyltransferase MoeB [Gottfriedia solisilvae]|uniref:Thiamine/molybdopterin biosynthesis protein MoeB n=1 Tax=Gottfriedia solisilvae TaxID=1516104 RepID=A0A8J3F2B6_9BACI|nr:molybdopterin-synthase adenylyltransferase MoeB [Gottfriedia solisilvae]GGI17809.1 thiamine/molybdopterin biosynthesis protein MoeB [Gottfriedia solisilvae]